MYNTTTLYTMLYGEQRQGVLYQSAVCNLLLDAMIKDRDIAESQANDFYVVSRALTDTLNRALGVRSIHKTLLTLLIGLDGLNIYESYDHSNLRGHVSPYASPESGEPCKCEVGYSVFGTRTKTRDLTYAEMVEKLIDVWKVGAPEDIKSDALKAFYMMAYKEKDAEVMDSSRDTSDTVSALCARYSNYAPTSVKAICTDQEYLGVYAYAMSHKINLERTCEYEHAIACDNATPDFLAGLDFPIFTLKSVLFGGQQQGSAFMSTLTALTAKWLMAYNQEIPSTNADMAALICATIEKDYSKKRKASCVAQVLMGKHYFELEEQYGENMPDIKVEATQIGDHGKYEFKPYALAAPASKSEQVQKITEEVMNIGR